MKKNTEFLKELLTAIKEQPQDWPKVIDIIQSKLDSVEQFSRILKKLSVYATLIASILVNVLQSFGVW